LIGQATPGEKVKLDVWRQGAALAGVAGRGCAARGERHAVPASAQQISQVLARAGKSVALLIQRGDEKIFVPVQVG
jgi:hypothetical protein